MTKVFTRQFKVRWSEVDATNRVPAAKIIEYLVETAYDWGAANGLKQAFIWNRQDFDTADVETTAAWWKSSVTFPENFTDEVMIKVSESRGEGF
jgi:acyl-CoA thioesterase FadM